MNRFLTYFLLLNLLSLRVLAIDKVNTESWRVDTTLEEMQERIQGINGEIEALVHRVELLEQKISRFNEGESKKVGETTPVFGEESKPSKKVHLTEQQLYQEALSCLPERYKAGEAKLREYLERYPTGSYVDNAHYWLGELNLLQSNYDAAEEEFQLVLADFSDSKRVPEAKFKLALVYYAQGRKELAIASLRKLLKQMPNSSVGQLAKQQLQQWGV